jgi:hypothetical protein
MGQGSVRCWELKMIQTQGKRNEMGTKWPTQAGVMTAWEVITLRAREGRKALGWWKCLG